SHVSFFLYCSGHLRFLHSFPTRRSSDLFIGCALSLRSERRRRVLRASGKAVSTWPLAIAVDAGLMEIQLWEGGVLRCAGTGPRRATHDTLCQEAGYHKKVSR